MTTTMSENNKISENSDKDTKVVFLHIPKTAGTVVHEILAARFEKAEICPERFRGLGKYSVEELEKFRYFSGHFTMSQVDRIPGKKFVFTIVRNPVDRILSLYYFWRRHRDEFVRTHKLRGPRLAKKLPLVDFLAVDQQTPRDAIDNEMARILAGAVWVGDGGLYYEGAIDNRRLVSRFEVIRRAVNALTRIDYVASIDSLDDDLKAIFLKLGWGNYSCRTPRINTRQDLTENLEQIDDQELGYETWVELNRLTELDQIVYTIGRLRSASTV